MAKLMTGICFFSPKDDKLPLKYRNINNEQKFINYVKEKGVMYVNFYSKETKEFIKRVWIQEFRRVK